VEAAILDPTSREIRTGHLLAAADEVTTSNDDAGVARVLERLFGAQARPTGDFVNLG